MSTLPSLAPYGLGTLHAESLTSYLRRLAWWEHASVSRLLRRYALDPLRDRRSQRELIVAPTRASESLNGPGAVAAALVDEVERLTGRSDLAGLSFLGREGGIWMREAFRGERAWCPLCLAVDESRAYDRLIWTLRDIAVCTVHEVALVTSCATCGRSHRPLAQWAYPFRCPWCGSALASNPVASTPSALITAARRLLPLLLQPGGAPRTLGPELAKRAREQHSSLRAVARASGISAAELSAITRGRVRPHLRAALALELATAGGVGTRTPTHARPKSDEQRDRRLRKALRRAGRAPEGIPSLRRLAARLGTTAAHLHQVDPDATALLINQMTAVRRRSVAARRAIVTDSIRAGVALASRFGSGFGRRRIERHLGKPGVLRAPWARAALGRAKSSAARPQAERSRRAMSNP
jgi:transcriptional regulator with XRE-family HTH domain